MASLILRLGLGIMFTAHGLQKVFGLFGGPGIKGFAGFIERLGFVPPIYWATVAAYTELICGICLILGLGTRISSALLLAVMFVALIKVHLGKGFFLMAGGFEYIFIIISALIALMILGTGKIGLIKKY